MLKYEDGLSCPKYLYDFKIIMLKSIYDMYTHTQWHKYLLCVQLINTQNYNSCWIEFIILFN